jgi:hypothetical protein
MNYMLLWKPGFLRKLQKSVFVVLIKIHNFEQYYTCKRKPEPTKGCNAADDDDYTCTLKKFTANAY